MSVTTPSRPAAEQQNKDFHWTADRFYRAANAGVFDDPGRLELIHGRIIEKMPQSPLHRAYRVRASRCLQAVLPSYLEVVDECPIHIAFDGEPIPDVVVLRGMGADDVHRHPTPDDVVLLIEVAVSSAEGDLAAKALLYSQAAIADYWVVLPEAGEIVLHRDPSENGYRDVTRVGEQGTVIPLAAPASILPVRDLLGLPTVGEGTA